MSLLATLKNAPRRTVIGAGSAFGAAVIGGVVALSVGGGGSSPTVVQRADNTVTTTTMLDSTTSTTVAGSTSTTVSPSTTTTDVAGYAGEAQAAAGDAAQSASQAAQSATVAQQAASTVTATTTAPTATTVVQETTTTVFTLPAAPAPQSFQADPLPSPAPAGYACLVLPTFGWDACLNTAPEDFPWLSSSGTAAATWTTGGETNDVGAQGTCMAGYQEFDTSFQDPNGPTPQTTYGYECFLMAS